MHWFLDGVKVEYYWASGAIKCHSTPTLHFGVSSAHFSFMNQQQQPITKLFWTMRASSNATISTEPPPSPVCYDWWLCQMIDVNINNDIKLGQGLRLKFLCIVWYRGQLIFDNQSSLCLCRSLTNKVAALRLHHLMKMTRHTLLCCK
jgi:hypothetical protein